MPTPKLPCRRVDPEVFFPVGTGYTADRQTEIAKALCDPCPIKAACLDHAIQTGQMYGVWGGTSPEERVEIRSEMIRRTTSRTLKTRGDNEDHRTRTPLVRELASQA